ncbi:MAG: hypothetical protein HXY50_07145 [Ignavibacteriaceae bacterium]|nr:hypothetical protein [Ignavibacteriaceae bacterium]
MINKFLQNNIWSEITSLSKKSNRSYVAVAYLGTGASKLLHLKNSDILIVNFSLAAIRSGQTSPEEIIHYISKGVKVYSCSNLHSKVFVFDNKVIIGSSNVSNNSKNNLVESAILTNDKNVVASSIGFIFSLTNEHITPAYAKKLKKDYKKDYKPSFLNKLTSKNKSDRISPTLWICRIFDAEFEDYENKICSTEEKKAKKKIINKKEFIIGSIRFGSKSTISKNSRFGDFIIYLYKENGKLFAYPPARIISKRNYKSKKGNNRTLIFTEDAKNPNTIDWKLFSTILKKIGTHRISENMTREIRNVNSKQFILGQWKSLFSH